MSSWANPRQRHSWLLGYVPPKRTRRWPKNDPLSGEPDKESSWKVAESILDCSNDLATDEFEQQKAAFQKIPPLILAAYQGQFVASHSGEILDSDNDLTALVRRFFAIHGDIAAYITKIGEPMTMTVRTPFFRHP